MAQTMSPLIPVALKLGQTRSADRLIQSEVFCMDPNRILISARVDLLCFDKTGTLTEQGLAFQGFQESITSEKDLHERMIVPGERLHELEAVVQMGLASCHTLTSLKSTGELIGNEVEKKMFTATNWKFSENDPLTNDGLPMFCPPEIAKGRVAPSPVYLLRRFEFDNDRMLQSVIVQSKDNESQYVFCKGSMESICGRCALDSNNLSEGSWNLQKYEEYANQGFYCLALAYKNITPETTFHEVLTSGRDVFEKVLCDMQNRGNCVLQLAAHRLETRHRAIGRDGEYSNGDGNGRQFTMCPSHRRRGWYLRSRTFICRSASRRRQQH